MRTTAHDGQRCPKAAAWVETLWNVSRLLDVPQHRQEVLLRVRWVEIRLRGVHGRLLRVPLRLENVRRLALRGCEVRRPAIGAPPALSETLAHRGEFGLVLGCIALLL